MHQHRASPAALEYVTKVVARSTSVAFFRYPLGDRRCLSQEARSTTRTVGGCVVGWVTFPSQLAGTGREGTIGPDDSPAPRLQAPRHRHTRTVEGGDMHVTGT